MSDETNGVRYTTREALDRLRDEMLSEFAELKADVQAVQKDISELKEFRAAMKDSIKVLAFIITTAVAISMGLLYSGVFK